MSQTNFSGIRTFAFRDSGVENRTESTTAYDSPFVEQRTHAAIAAQLEARGLRSNVPRPTDR